MTYRPAPRIHALAVVLAAIISLAILAGRADLLFVAIPVLMPLIRAARPRRPPAIELLSAELDSDQVIEGTPLTLIVAVRLSDTDGSLEIRPLLSPLAEFVGVQAGTRRKVGADKIVRWSIEVVCRGPGRLEIAGFVLRYHDPAGASVVERSVACELSAEIYPRSSSVSILPEPIRAANPFGSHLSHHFGDGMDFGEIRPFTPGDRLKRINWLASLRTGTPQVNQFHTEQCSDVVLLIDCFADIGVHPNSSLDHSRRIASGLAAGYLRRHDRVGLMAFGGWLQVTPRRTGPAQLDILRRAMARIALSPSALVRDLATLSGAVLPKQALIIALTPLTDPRFAKAICALADQGRDVVALSIRTDLLSEQLAPHHRFSSLIRRLWRLERAILLKELRRHGIRTVAWAPSEAMDPVLAAISKPRRAGARR